MTQAEKMALARAIVRAELPLDEAVQIGTDTYVLETPHGFVKVSLVAVKGDFDPEQAHQDFLFDREEARVKAEARKAKAEATRLAKEARKASKG